MSFLVGCQPFSGAIWWFVARNHFENHQDLEFDYQENDDTASSGYGKLGTDNTEMGQLSHFRKCEYWSDADHSTKAG
jgi:hypothetical protein